MPLPSFTVTGNLNDILPVPTAGELTTEAWESARVVFTHNIKRGVLVLDDAIYNRPPEVGAFPDSDGDISPIVLLANDAGLNVSGIQWTATVLAGGNALTEIVFNAPADGGTVDLATVAPVPYANPVGITKGDPGPGIDDVQLDGDDVNFYVEGEIVGTLSAATLMAGTQATLGAVKTITVGSGGDFSTLNAAIKEATKFAAQYVFAANRLANPFIEIKQLAGFVMSEQVFVVGQDLSYIHITSVDAEVTIQRSALTTSLGDSTQNWRTGTFPAFTAARGAGLPCIKTLYSMNTSGTGAGTVGVLVYEGSHGVIFKGCGVKNAGWRGLYVEGSTCYARATVWDGAGYVSGPEGTLAGIRVSNGAVANLREASAKDCASGIYVSAASVNVIDVDVSGSGSGSPSSEGYGLTIDNSWAMGAGVVADDCLKYGVYVLNGGHCYIGADSDGDYLSATDCGLSAVRVDGGSTLIAPHATLSSDTSHCINVTGSSWVDINTSTAISAAGRGISASDGARVTAQAATITGTSDWGARLFSSELDATGAKIGGTSGGVQLNTGSVLHKNGATALDGTSALNCNVAAGQITANGVVLGADAVKTVNVNITALVNDTIHLYTGSTPRTATLPAVSASAGRVIIVKNASSALVTVQRAGSDGIYFNSSSSVTSVDVIAGGAITVWCDGFEWIVTSYVSASPTFVAPALGTPASGNLANCTFPTLNQNTTGSAATLTTPRNIDGQAFNGSAAITVIAPGTHAATGKTTPVDADELPLVDSAAANVLKKLTWGDLKAAIAAYIVGAAPGALDTLDELAAALGDDANYAATITTALAGKEPTITAGTTAQYRRGDKSWQTLNQAAVPATVSINPSTLIAGSVATCTGTSPRTCTLPAGSASSGLPCVVKNVSTALVTVQRAGSDGIYVDSTSSATSFTIPPGGAAVLYWDGFEWVTSSLVGTKRNINAQTSTTYTLALVDISKVVTLDNASAITLTVPTNATLPFPVGTQIDLAQLGAGQATIAGAGVTFVSTPGLKIAAQYGAARLLKLATDTWLVTGDLAA